MTERGQLLLDRALLLSALLDRDPASAEVLEAAVPGYATLLYEAAGASGIESALRSRAVFADKLVATPANTIAVDDEERQLLRTTVEASGRSVPVLRALRGYDQEVDQRGRDSDEVLGYVVRLLLLARQLDADLLPWPARVPLILSLFEAAGVVGVVSQAPAGFATMTFEPCSFPYVPPRGPYGRPFRFRLLIGPRLRRESIGASDDVGPAVPGQAGTKEQNQRTIFISYSHRDRRWLELLTTMLRPLVRDGSLDVWSDRRIMAGGDWRAEIDQALTRSGVAILLVTANFLASDFIARNELPPLLAAAAARRTAVLWVPVSGSLYQHTELGRLQALHDPAVPLDTLAPARRQQALAAIAEKIAELSSMRS